MKRKTIYLIAPSYQLAQHYAHRNQLAPNEWVSLSTPDKLNGLTKEDTIIWIADDQAGRFVFDTTSQRTLNEAIDRHEQGRIDLRAISMETPIEKALQR